MAAAKLQFWERLDPRRRQWITVGLAVGAVLFIFWAIFTLTEKPKPAAAPPALGAAQKHVTNVGVMVPGQQLSAEDGWLGKAGKDVAQLKQDRETQAQQNEEQKTFNRDILSKFDKLQQDLAKASAASSAQRPPGPIESATQAQPANPPQLGLPPAPPPQRPGTTAAGLPPGLPPLPVPEVGLTRISLRESGAKPLNTAPTPTNGRPATSAPDVNEAHGRKIDSYLPISFTRAIVLGGLDAPTGGQAQTNPQPVLLMLEDNALLPNRFRAQVRDCFVIGAGYGDISSERAYIRTERLSCVRNDGTAMELKIKGSIFDENGKVGMKGRLVTKQGQILANALIAGVVSGIGEGFQNRYTTTSTSTFGTIATTNSNDAFQAGISSGVGRAMDRLAQYYISLADKIFPIIEVDSGRIVNVVITEGTVIDPPFDSSTSAETTAPHKAAADDAHNDEVTHAEN